MATYYVSTDGDDTADGLSKATPWKTITRALQNALGDGDHIRFRRGDTFYGALNGARRLNSWALGNVPITFSAYGVGKRPIIRGYKILPAGSWVAHAANIWKIAINDPALVGGNTALTGASGANIGFLRVDGAIKGAKVFSLDALIAAASDWGFYSDEASWLYVWSATNPGLRATQILAAPGQIAITNLSGARYAGIEFQGFGAHGKAGSDTDVTIGGCVFREIGGSRLIGYSNPTTRYGNGAECWVGSARVSIKGNQFIDVYDVGFTMQGKPVNTANSTWADITCRNNRFIRCNQVIEVWATYGDAANAGVCPAGSGFVRTAFEHNEAWDTGYGWSNAVRPDQGTKCPILLYLMEAPGNDISIQYNRFHGFSGPLIHRPTGMTGLPAGMVMDHNTVVFDGASHLIHDQMAYTADAFDSFAAATGIGTGCAVQVLGSSDPMTAGLDAMSGHIASGIASANAHFEASANLAADAIIADANGDTALLTAGAGLASYTTATTQVIDVTKWAPLLTVTITGQYSRFDGFLAYATGGDSNANRGGAGFLNLQFVPNAGLTGLASCNIDLLPLMNFLNFTSNSFAVVANGDGTKVTVQLLFNIGVKNYISLKVSPIDIIAGSFTSFAFQNNAALIALPAGTVTYSSTANHALAFRPASGAGAPAVAPGRVGDSYLDTSNKRSYRAFGTGSAGDWLSDQAMTGSGAPTAAPARVGDRYIDTTNKVSYTTTGTSSVSDWNQESVSAALIAYDTTLTNTVDATKWAPILTVTLKNSSARFDGLLSYLTGSDSTSGRGGVGFLNLQLVANSGLTGLSYCGIDLIQLMPFLALNEASFACVVNGDGTTITCQIFVNIGLDNYLTMRVSPIDIITTGGSYASYAFQNKGALVTLPSGTVTYSSVNNTTTPLPLKGNGAPSAVPPRVGALYLDLTNRKEYRAFGTASVSDWVVLN